MPAPAVDKQLSVALEAGGAAVDSREAPGGALSHSTICTHLEALGAWPEEGRAASAPAVSADIQVWLQPPSNKYK